METKKMNFVELRHSMAQTLLSGIEEELALSCVISGLWMTWKSLHELYHDKSMYWCVSRFTEVLLYNLPEDADRFNLIFKITRVGEREYEVEEIKVAD